mmetsp:Transcript_25231/g.64102  ORF Transcript_25231/g.64102 Transcript_25231/m.64102 type:complete len:227 (-) Transcript_25231:3030-3710(-)
MARSVSEGFPSPSTATAAPDEARPLAGVPPGPMPWGSGNAGPALTASSRPSRGALLAVAASEPKRTALAPTAITPPSAKRWAAARRECASCCLARCALLPPDDRRRGSGGEAPSCEGLRLFSSSVTREDRLLGRRVAAIAARCVSSRSCACSSAASFFAPFEVSSATRRTCAQGRPNCNDSATARSRSCISECSHAKCVSASTCCLATRADTGTVFAGCARTGTAQ